MTASNSYSNGFSKWKSSSHHGCFNTKSWSNESSDLDDLGVTPILGNVHIPILPSNISNMVTLLSKHVDFTMERVDLTLKTCGF